MARRSLDQKRAANAYAAALPAGEGEVDFSRLPAMLQINGLLATWAFLLSKKENGDKALTALLGHLRSRPELGVAARGGAAEVFRSWVGRPGDDASGLDGTALRALTAEALAFAVWLKRAEEAAAPEPAAGGAGGGGGGDGGGDG